MLRNIVAVSVATVLSCNSMQAFAASDKSDQDASASKMQHDAVTFPMRVFDETQTQAIEDIVRNYLLKNPELLLEVSRKLQQQQLAEQEQQYQVVIDKILADKNLPMEGKANSKHYLIEFFDYNCGYCKAAREYIYRLAEEEDLRIYYIEMPVLSPMSVQASAIGLALFKEDPDKYLKYQKYLMDKKDPIKSEDQIKEAVKHVDANYDDLAERFKNDPQVQALLRQNMDYGEGLGVQGVPLFVLDGHIIRGVVKNYDALKAFLIDDQ